MSTVPRSSTASARFPSGGIRLAAPLVSACRHLLQPNGSISGNEVANSILPNFPDLCSALPADYFANRPALLGIDKRKPVTHARVRDFILKEFGPALHQLGYGRGHRIALVLPNGPELGLAILCIAHWASCLPLNANGATSELKKDLQAAKASLIIGIFDDSAAIQDMASALRIPFCGLKPSQEEVGIFTLIPMPSSTPNPTLVDDDMESDEEICCATDPVCGPSSPEGAGRIFPGKGKEEESKSKFFSNEHEDEVLVLFTSGTTGNKKLVPHKLGDMLIAAAVIAVSWNLSPEDINCNLMPLFHVGGIVRQIFAPILSGGSVICCPSFDPQLFWNLLLANHDKHLNYKLPPSFTWYYAAPTMHQVILGSMPQGATPKLRMIANAAGGLLPSLAQELRNVFGANVLPSYGMTECMPISSPPYNYQLQKPGTSGVAVGPEIRIFSANFEVCQPRKEGNICVRGRPCFHGYGGQSQGSSFLEGGWFNTGDLGYLDEDGYLYITGRSKEVINRGGEIISPMEVEEEVLQHYLVSTCLAFSAPHDVLQEIVGIVIVPVPGLPKIDIPTLHEFLQERLAPAKWPQCLVYMDALPRSHTNKLLRVKLGQRYNLPEMNDGMHPVERTFEATCPPQGTPVGVSIPCEQVTVDAEYVQELLQEEMGILPDSYVDLKDEIDDEIQSSPVPERQLLVTPHPSRVGGLVVHVVGIDRREVALSGKKCLDAYLIPTHIRRYSNPITLETVRKVPDKYDAVGYILSDSSQASVDVHPMVQELQEMIQEMIDLDCLPAPDTNFFHIGGSSLLASQLASRVRKLHDVSFSGADVFRHNTCLNMAKRIMSQKPELKRSRSLMDDSTGCSATESDTIDPSRQCPVDLQDAPFEPARKLPQASFLSALIQLIPICVVFPLWQFSRFFLFFMSLLQILHRVPMEQNFVKFILTLVVFHFVWVTVTPLIFVLLKWLIIGKYQQGRYAFWSGYYLRWWFIDVCRKMFGHGIWGSSNHLLVFYYRLLGASIGSGVQISLEADIAEYDLISIGDNAKIEYSSVRGFGVDNGAMILAPVNVGDSSSVGIRSIVAPYTAVPSGAHVGPASSSYEITHQDDRHLLYNRSSVPEPSYWMLLFIGNPIIWVANTISHIPAMYVLYCLVSMHVRQDDFSFQSIGDLMEWLCEPKRIPYYVGIRVARAVIAPFVYMAVAIVIKWTIIGKFQPGPRDITSQWQLMRHWLAAKLFSRENMQEVTDMLGRHYETISTLYRLLGARVGKRIFWPGHQPVFSGEFDLLEIGDDVVFGSRTSIIASTIETCEKVIFCAGANISDNTVVLPGSIIGKNAVLGSNTVCPAGRYLPESSIWIGSKGGEPVALEAGTEAEYGSEVILASDVKYRDLPMKGDETTLRPFGKAVERREASYFVWPVSMMIFLNIFCNTLFSVIHAVPLLSSLFISGAILYGYRLEDRQYDDVYYTPLQLFATALSVFAVVHFIRILFCLILEIVGKWILMGRRTEGRYNW